MSSGNAKELRKATRAVVQEILPALLQSEVFSELYARLQKEMINVLTRVEGDIKADIAKMESRSRDVQQYIMNTVLADQAKAAAAQVPKGALDE